MIDKTNSKNYYLVSEFKKDLKRIWENCLQFNAGDPIMEKNANNLKEFVQNNINRFDDKLIKITEKINEIIGEDLNFIDNKIENNYGIPPDIEENTVIIPYLGKKRENSKINENQNILQKTEIPQKNIKINKSKNCYKKEKIYQTKDIKSSENNEFSFSKNNVDKEVEFKNEHDIVIALEDSKKSVSTTKEDQSNNSNYKDIKEGECKCKWNKIKNNYIFIIEKDKNFPKDFTPGVNFCIKFE